jgi:hypothetical protein
MSEAVGYERGREAAAGAPFSIGRVFNQTFSVFRQGFAQFLILTAIANIPMLILALATIGRPDAEAIGEAFEPLLKLIVTPIATATCLFGAYQVMRGRDFTVGESLSVALSRFWSVLGVSIVGGLLTGLLSLLLVVPGVIYASMIFVALPACVIERLRPMGSLRRSRELTKGYRWSMFAMLIFIGVVAAMLSAGALLAATLIAGPFVGAVANFAGDVLVGAFAAVLYAVVYRDLRAEKEGVDVEQLASVFD